MAKFTFKYESVLRHRCVIEDLRQREMARELRQRMIIEDQLRLMQRTIMESKRELGAALTGKVDLQQIAQFTRYGGQVTQRAHGFVRKLAQIEKQIEHARQRLIDATRQRQAIELLRQRHHQQWLLEQDRRETAQLDELALQSHLRTIGELT